MEYDILDALEMSGTEHLKNISEAYNGLRGYKTRMAVYALVNELDTMICAGELSFEWLARWFKRLQNLSVGMPVMVDYGAYCKPVVSVEGACDHAADCG